MAPKKRGAPKKSSEGSPKRQRQSPSKNRSEDGPPPSTEKKPKVKVTWRFLPLDTVEPSTVSFNIDGAEDDVDGQEDSFTAHCDATVRASAMADWLQQGANAEGHIDDVVAVNDTFAAKVEEDVEKMDLAVVKELEAGSVPDDVLPKPVSSLFRQRDEPLHGSDATAERDVAAKLQTDRDLDGLWEAWGVQQREKGEEIDDASSSLPTPPSLQLGATFPSMQAADNFVRIQSKAPMRVVPGTSKKCRVWCCRSNRTADKADGTRADPAARGSRATSLLSGGCDALVQVQTCQLKPTQSHQPQLTFPTDCSLGQVQEVTVGQLRRGAWNRTAFTKQFYGTSQNEWDDITQSVVQRNPLPAVPEACPNLLPVNNVFALTLFKEHSCLAVPEPPAPSGSSCTTSVPSSASALHRAGAFGRKVPAQQLASALRAGFELHGRKWTGKQVFVEIRKLDPSTNIHMAHHVLSRLRRPVVMSAPFNPILLQGLASALRKEGWGVVLHVADADSVCAQIEDIARKQYAAHCRAHPGSRLIKFDVKHISSVLEQYSSEEAQSQEYIMGFTLVPPNMMRGGLAQFPPFDAIDAASMRDYAAGVMINRATKDGNDNVHLISTSVMLASESGLSLDATQSAETLLLGEDNPLSHPDHVTITDGGIALLSSQVKHHRRASLWRCYRHLKADLLRRCKASAQILDKLVGLPPGRVHAADELMAELPPHSPLRKVPKEQFCQAYMASNVSLHGNVTNNMVEISNHMLARARSEHLLFKAMQVTAETVKHRLDELRSTMLDKKASSLDKPVLLLSPDDSFPEGNVTPATQRAWEIVQSKAKDLPPPVRVARGGLVTTDEFEVRRTAEKVSRVNLSYLPHGPFLALCDCGKSSTHKLWCECVQSVFHHSTGDWRRWLKPWRTSSAWEKQLGPAFNSPTGGQICVQVKFLSEEGSLHQLKQPMVRPTSKGRPAKLKPTAASQRIRSSLEGVAESVRAQQSAGDVAAGACLSKNPGGRGVRKKCGRCGEHGHRRSKCPLIIASKAEKDVVGLKEEAAPMKEEPASTLKGCDAALEDTLKECDAASLEATAEEEAKKCAAAVRAARKAPRGSPKERELMVEAREAMAKAEEAKNLAHASSGASGDADDAHADDACAELLQMYVICMCIPYTCTHMHTHTYIPYIQASTIPIHIHMQLHPRQVC